MGLSTLGHHVSGIIVKSVSPIRNDIFARKNHTEYESRCDYVACGRSIITYNVDMDFFLVGSTKKVRVALARVLFFVCLTAGSVVGFAQTVQAYAVSEDFDDSGGNIANTIFDSAGSVTVTSSNCEGSSAYCLYGSNAAATTSMSSSTAGQMVFYVKRTTASPVQLNVSLTQVGVCGVQFDAFGEAWAYPDCATPVKVAAAAAITQNVWYPVIFTWRAATSSIEMQVCFNGNCTAYYDTNKTDFSSLRLAWSSGADWVVDTFSYTSSKTAFTSSDGPYAVITAPIDGGVVPYSFDVDGELDFPTASSSVVSYAVTFVSQTGLDYSSTNIYATTSDLTEYVFTHPVEMAIDDIVYVRVYLYDNDSWNAAGLVYISPEYEFWVSSTGDTTSVIDMGTFRTNYTDFCQDTFYSATSSAASAFGYVMCNVIRYLAVPSESTIEKYSELASTTSQVAPFSYMVDIADVFETASSSFGTATVTPATLELYGQEVDLYNQDSFTRFVDASTWATVRSVVTGSLWFMFILMVYQTLTGYFVKEQTT